MSEKKRFSTYVIYKQAWIGRSFDAQLIFDDEISIRWAIHFGSLTLIQRPFLLLYFYIPCTPNGSSAFAVFEFGGAAHPRPLFRPKRTVTGSCYNCYK